MKTYAPKGLHGGDLRGLLDDLACTPAQAAKFLRVTERSIWRWLAEDSAPYAVLACLWHETPRGRETSACDVGNELVLQRVLAKSSGAALSALSVRVARLVRISDTGAANDPLANGPGSEQAQLTDLARGPALGLFGGWLGLEPAPCSPGRGHGKGPAHGARR